MLAACWSVEVIKGGLGFVLIGFFTISLINKFELRIRVSIFFASSSFKRGSDFFLFKLNGILSESFDRLIETSQNSSGINS